MSLKPRISRLTACLFTVFLLVPAAGADAAKHRAPVRLKLKEALPLASSLSPTTPLTKAASCPRSAPQPVGPDFGLTGSGDLGFITLDAFRAGSSRRFQISVGPLGATGPQEVLMGAMCAGGPAKLAHARGAGSIGPMQNGGGSINCPGRAPHPLAGYFAPDTPSQLGQILLTGSYPVSAKGRTWVFDIENVSPNTVPYTVSVICAPATVRTQYLENDNVTAPPGKDSGLTEPCRLKAFRHAVSGFFGGQTDSDDGTLAVDGSFPSSSHNWSEGVRNISSTPRKAFFGVVCVA